MSSRIRNIAKAFRRFRRAERGSAAVEFGLVIMPFFLLTFALAEISMIGFAQTSLDFAVAETARQIRTGEAQMGGVSEADIHEELCGELNNFIMMECDDNLFLDVNTFASFVDANENDSPIEDGEFQEDGFDYDPGAPSDIVVVRAYYRWAIMTPMFEAVFQNVSGGERILVATMMFRNEPYQ